MKKFIILCVLSAATVGQANAAFIIKSLAERTASHRASVRKNNHNLQRPVIPAPTTSQFIHNLAAKVSGNKKQLVMISATLHGVYKALCFYGKDGEQCFCRNSTGQPKRTVYNGDKK